MRQIKSIISLMLISASFCGCSKLSKEAREITGIYYNHEISQNEPVMELHKNATCLIRAIKPGVLTYSVEGEWNVENDSLIINVEPSTLKFEGDSTIIGDIPYRIARKITSHNGLSLQLEKNGVSYIFQRQK